MTYSCVNEQSARFVVAQANIIPINDQGIVYWSLMNWGADIEKFQQVEIFRKVFEFYNYELWPIKFESSSDPDKAYFKIAYVSPDGKGKLNDGTEIQSPFIFADNPGTIAVFHFNTGGKWSGWGFLNEEFYFALSHAEDRTELYKVLQHELGHGLGLQHTNAPNDIMLPVYNPLNDFTSDSRNGMNQIYGQKRRDLMTVIPGAQYLKKERTPIYSAKPFI